MPKIKHIKERLKFYLYRLNILNNKKFFVDYNDNELNLSIIDKTIKYKNSKINHENLDINETRCVNFANVVKAYNFSTILDFGGGAGYHYFLAKKYLYKEKIDWNIVENEMMVNLCKIHLNEAELSFIKDLKKIEKKIHIVFSSCAINYCDNPLMLLKELLDLPCEYYYFTRTPLSLNSNFKYQQFSRFSENGPINEVSKINKGVKVMNNISTKKEFEEIINNNFDIIYSYEEQKNAFKYKKNTASTYTYFLKRKKL